MEERRRLRWSHVLVVVLAITTGLLVWLADRQLQTSVQQAVARPLPPEVSAPSNAPVPPFQGTTDLPAAVFIGDGYTAGTDGHSWADLVASQRGWREVNLAEAGMGYKTVPRSCASAPCTAFGGLLTQVADANPAVVFVMGGASDGRSLTAGQVDSYVKALRSTVPDATIYLLNPVVTDNTVPKWVGTTTEAIKEAAADHDARFVDIGQPLSGNRDLAAKAGAPTEAGHQAIAELVLQGIG